LQALLTAAEGRVAELANRIGTLKAKMKEVGGDGFGALVDLLVDLERDKVAAAAVVERLKRDMTTTETEALDRTKELILAVRRGTPDEVHLLRLKLRTALRRIVKNITILVVKVNDGRAAIADVELTSGVRRRLVVSSGSEPAPIPDAIRDLDLRTFADWPPELKAVKFGVETDAGRRMRELEASGLSRTAIAASMGASKSQVSRTLNSDGGRKQRRKPADSEERMSWHPAGCGWTKTYRGKRYFVGLGALAAAYPDLVTARDRAGSASAANAWWAARLAELDK